MEEIYYYSPYIYYMIIAIIQARTGSTRLPGKALKEILGKPMLAWEIERVKLSKKIDKIVVATTDKKEDNTIAELAKKAKVSCYRGSEKDVLDRFYHAAKEVSAKTVVRLTGDCPLMDPQVIDEVVEHFIKNPSIDYMGTPSNYPEGLDTEIFSFSSLETAWKNAILPSEREHVTPYFKNHPEKFKGLSWTNGKEDFSKMHWSVDTAADFTFVTEIFTRLSSDSANQQKTFYKNDVLALLKKHPELLKINEGGTGYEGLAKSLKEDVLFKKSLKGQTKK